MFVGFLSIGSEANISTLRPSTTLNPFKAFTAARIEVSVTAGEELPEVGTVVLVLHPYKITVEMIIATEYLVMIFLSVLIAGGIDL
jgi:hypothetical protein